MTVWGEDGWQLKSAVFETPSSSSSLLWASYVHVPPPAQSVNQMLIDAANVQFKGTTASLKRARNMKLISTFKHTISTTHIGYTRLSNKTPYKSEQLQRPLRPTPRQKGFTLLPGSLWHHKTVCTTFSSLHAAGDVNAHASLRPSWTSLIRDVTPVAYIMMSNPRHTSRHTDSLKLIKIWAHKQVPLLIQTLCLCVICSDNLV